MIRRQELWLGLRKRLESMSREEDVKSALALATSEMHMIGDAIAVQVTDEPECRPTFLFRSTGILISPAESMRETRWLSTFIREHVSFMPSWSGIGIILDPHKVNVIAAFTSDAKLHSEENEFSTFDSTTGKHKRRFIRQDGSESYVTDYAMYSTQKFEGNTWEAKFPNHTIAALSYKISVHKDNIIENSVVVDSCSDAVIGIVYVGGPHDIDEDAIRDVRFCFPRPLPVFKYENYQLSLISTF